MNAWIRGFRGAVLTGAAVAMAGCSQLGGLGNVLGGVLSPAGSGSSEVYGTVQTVDTQRQLIQVQTQNGQLGSVYFDGNTQVVYQNQRYPVTSLERGDQVGMRLQQAQNGGYYTDYITVTQSVQESGGGSVGSGSFTQVAGNVTWVDTQRGQFGLNSNRGTVTVVMPYSANASDANRFRTLRTGDNVRVEGQLVASGRLELSRFY